MYVFQIIVAICSIILWAILLVVAFQIPYPTSANFFSGGGSFPSILCVLIIIMNIWWIANSYKIIKKSKVDNLLEKSKDQENKLREFLFGTKEQEKNLFIMMLITVIYIFVLVPLFARINRNFGYMIATIVFLIVAIKKFSNNGWIKTISISATTSIILYTVMNNILRLPMPK